MPGLSPLLRLEARRRLDHHHHLPVQEARHLRPPRHQPDPHHHAGDPGRGGGLLGRPAEHSTASRRPRASRFGLTRVIFAHPCGIPHELVENPDDTRTPIVNEAQGTTAQVAIKGIYGGGSRGDGCWPRWRNSSTSACSSAAKAPTPRAACGSCRDNDGLAFGGRDHHRPRPARRAPGCWRAAPSTTSPSTPATRRTRSR